MLVGEAVFLTGIVERIGHRLQPGNDDVPGEAVLTLLAQQLRKAAAIARIDIFHLGKGPAISATTPAPNPSDMGMIQLGGQLDPRPNFRQISAQADNIGALRPLVTPGFPQHGRMTGGQENLDGLEFFGGFAAAQHRRDRPHQPDALAAQIMQQADSPFGGANHQARSQRFYSDAFTGESQRQHIRVFRDAYGQVVHDDPGFLLNRIVQHGALAMRELVIGQVSSGVGFRQFFQLRFDIHKNLWIRWKRSKIKALTVALS